MYHGQVVIEGNLTQEPQLSLLPSGRSVCTFSIASNRYYRNTEKEVVNEVCYVDIDTWGSLAETCSKYLRKGRGVRVIGRLKHDKWQDEDERFRERYVVVAEHVEFHPESNRVDQEGSPDPMESTSGVDLETEKNVRRGKKN